MKGIDLKKIRNYLNENENILQMMIDDNGKTVQSVIAMEELAELQVAILDKKSENEEEEIADVLICLKQLQMMYLISDTDIDRYMEKLRILYIKKFPIRLAELQKAISKQIRQKSGNDLAVKIANVISALLTYTVVLDEEQIDTWLAFKVNRIKANHYEKLIHSQ